MKSKRKVQRFDYSKYDYKSDTYCWDSDLLEQYEFWGFHPKHGRLHIDTKRYAKACKLVGIEDFLPEGLFEQRQTVYYEPTKVHEFDYKVNIFRTLLKELKDDWNYEFKPLLSKVITPKEVQESSRMNAICHTSYMDDLDEIDVEAALDGIRRMPKYEKVIQSLYCQFIQKVCTEVDRFTLIFMKEAGSNCNDFSIDRFFSFSDGLLAKKDAFKIESLSKYNAYNMLHKINNFLKHNSLASYNKLKKFYPNNVASVENGRAKSPYENGMFAGDWIVVKENYIDDLLDKLVMFFEDYCRVYLKEDIERSKWDYDDYFYGAKRQMQNPREYLGLY